MSFEVDKAGGAGEVDLDSDSLPCSFELLVLALPEAARAVADWAVVMGFSGLLLGSKRKAEEFLVGLGAVLEDDEAVLALVGSRTASSSIAKMSRSSSK